MAEENTKKATLEMVVTNEDGQQIEKKLEGENAYIEYILFEAGILSNDLVELLNAK